MALLFILNVNENCQRQDHILTYSKSHSKKTYKSTFVFAQFLFLFPFHFTNCLLCYYYVFCVICIHKTVSHKYKYKASVTT